MPTAMPTMPPSEIGVSNTRDRAVLGLQAFGAAEHAAEVADVLAEHHHVGVALEHHVHRRAQRLDHGHRACCRPAAERSPRHARVAAADRRCRRERSCSRPAAVGRAGAAASPCRRLRTSRRAAACGRRAACRSARPLSARPSPRPRAPSRRCSCSLVGPLRRARSGAASGARSDRRAESAASRRPAGTCDGSSEVEWAPAR